MINSGMVYFEIVSEIVRYASCVISSILLVKYYAAFLTPRYKNRFFSFAGFGVAYLLLLISSQLFFLQLQTIPFFSSFQIIAIAIVVYILSCIFFQRDFGKQIFLLCSFFALTDIAYSIQYRITDLFNIGLLELYKNKIIFDTEVKATIFSYVKNYSSPLLMLLIPTIVMALALRDISKNFTYKNYALRPSEIVFLVLPCLSALSIIYSIDAILISINSDSLTVFFNTSHTHILILMADIFILLTVIASVRLLQKTIQLHIDEKNTEVFQNQIDQLQEQIHGVDSIYTEIRGMRHDMKSHISSIRLLVKSAIEGNQDVNAELEEYLGKFGDAFDKFEFVYQTGNSVSDIIIHQKYLEAMDNRINFSADFIYPSRLNLNVYDLAVILNNGLENALEACTSIAPPDRFIRLYAFTKGEMLFIEIENSFTGQINLDKYSDLPISSKQDKTSHGMGLSNIQRCARKYFGDIDFKVSKAQGYSIFRLIVMLQGRV